MTTMRPVNDIVQDIFDRTDEYDLVVQKDGDSGDTAYRSAIFAILLKLVKHEKADLYYKSMIHGLTVSPGVFHRSNNPSHWGFNPNNFSRDQASALMLAASMYGDNETVELFYNKCYDRPELKQIPKYGKFLYYLNSFVGFHQNVHPGTDAPDSFRKVPDLVGISEARNEIRRKRQWYKYPLLMLRDIGFIIDLKLRKRQLWDFDSLYAKDLIYANQNMPTIFSYIAKKLYKRTDYLIRLRNNYADVNNGIEPLGELYERVCLEFINK